MKIQRFFQYISLSLLIALPSFVSAIELSDIDKTPPQVKVLNAQQGEFLRSTKNLRFLVTDYYGIKDLKVSFLGRTLLTAKNLDFSSEWSVTIRGGGRVGLAPVTFDVTDNAGNEISYDHNFHVWPTNVLPRTDVKMNRPLNGETLSGTRRVVLEATDVDPYKIVGADFLINGVLIGKLVSTVGSTLVYNLDTKRFADGAHTITAVVFNSAGNTADISKTIIISNGNSGSNPPTPTPTVAPTPIQNPDQPTPVPTPVQPTPTPANPTPNPTPAQPTPVPTPITPDGDENTALILQQMIASVTQLLQLLDQATENGGEVSEELQNQVLSTIAQVTAFLNSLTQQNAATLRSSDTTKRIPRLVKKTNRNMKKALKAKKKRKRNRQFKAGKRKLKRIQKAIGS